MGPPCQSISTIKKKKKRKGRIEILNRGIKEKGQRIEIKEGGSLKSTGDLGRKIYNLKQKERGEKGFCN